MNIALYCMTVFIWGTTWLAIACQLGSVPIEVSIFYRFGLASALIFLWCLLKRSNLKFSLETHLFLIFQGFFLFSMNYMAAYEANYYISSGLNSIGFSMVLVFNIINSMMFYRTPLTLPIAVGAISGMAGILIIFWPELSTLDFTNTSLLGIFLSLLGGILASFGNIISARNQKHRIPVMESNAFAMGYGALWMVGVLFLKGTPLSFDFSYTYIVSLMHLTIFGSIIAFGCYLTLLGRIGANKAAYALIMVPAVALTISTLFEGFVWELRTLLGIGLIFIGNIIILIRKPMKKAIETVSDPGLLKGTV